MKFFLILLLTLFTSINSLSQTSFEKGYFIDNQNSRVECLIKFHERNTNPSFFEYKLTLNSDVILTDVSHIKEYEIYIKNQVFKRFDVAIDKSKSEDITNLSRTKKPN